jgi:hypothetical protein
VTDEFTSQLYFPDELTDRVHRLAVGEGDHEAQMRLLFSTFPCRIRRSRARPQERIRNRVFQNEAQSASKLIRSASECIQLINLTVAGVDP